MFLRRSRGSNGAERPSCNEEVYECWPRCSQEAREDGCCAQHPSRWGIRHRLVVSMSRATPGHGFGIFTMERIPAFSVVMPYLGRVMRVGDADEGGSEGGKGRRRREYIGVSAAESGTAVLDP